MPFVSLKGTAANSSKSELWRYALEFIIVFLSVYLAFVLTDYQEESREREIRVKYYDNLTIELESMILHLDHEERELLVHTAVLEQIEQGSQPLIPASQLYSVFEGGVVDAALEGGNFEWLDPGLLENITRTKPLFEALDQRTARFNRLTGDLMPLQLDGEYCCYDDRGRLLPHLSWYPQIVKEMHELNRGIYAYVTEAALPEIQRQLKILQ